jgi:hypothetical protein
VRSSTRSTQPRRGHRSSIAKVSKPIGNLVPDAHLAALAIEHGLTLATTDAGFARFPDLSTIDPTQVVNGEPADDTG